MKVIRKCPHGTRRCRASGRCQKCRADKAAAGRRYRERVRNGESPECDPIELLGGSWVYTNGIASFVPDHPNPLCGSDSGYYHHRRQTLDQPCRACLDAHALAQRNRYRSRVLPDG